MTTRQLQRAPLRRRPYVLKTAEVVSGTTVDQETILTPTKGFRVRLTRVKILQTVADGRHLCELYFGDAGNLITDPSKGVDILAVPDGGSASTRTYLKNEGPRGLRGEALTLRWRGTAPANGHKVMIEYSEES